MLARIQTTPEEYQQRQPYPYLFQDGVIPDEMAQGIQEEIMTIPEEAWDRYENPFESKFTLRDKYQFPPRLAEFFWKLEQSDWVDHLSKVCGVPLRIDPTRNFWGVHKYNRGDKLDIHVDAGMHPTLGLKKQVTLGFYLSTNWKDTYGCDLEVWRGDSVADTVVHPRLYEKVATIAPMFNRMILFTCNDQSWHGNPTPTTGPEDAHRIFVTISYLSDLVVNPWPDQHKNRKPKAYFIARPEDPVDPEKDRLRELRADPERYKDVYRSSMA